MRIVYYTSGISGAGRLIFGISIGNALIRRGVRCAYTMLHTSPFAHLADDFHHIKIPLETETELSPERYRASILFKTLKKLKPDVLLVNHQWFMTYHFINELSCKKIYLSDDANEEHFNIKFNDHSMKFNSSQFDSVIAIEPFSCSIPMSRINPLIIRNHDEIFSREQSLQRIGLSGDKKIAFYGFSGHQGDFERHMEKYSFLKSDGYEVVMSSLYGENLFPAVDYYNAFDLVICGGGYNQVWETVYFQKKAIFETTSLQFSDQADRIRASQNFSFTENGADQLVDIILNL